MHNISKLVNLLLQVQYMVMNPYKSTINLKLSLLNSSCHLNPRAIEGLWLSLKSELPAIAVKVSVSCCHHHNYSRKKVLYKHSTSQSLTCMHSCVCVCVCACAHSCISQEIKSRCILELPS
jgi:hypothetical protein